jgi:Right handed beta helix region/Secretion system C-terminal sorting domain
MLKMKSTKCYYLFLFLPFSLFAQRTISISGSITANTQWNYDTVYLTGDLTIPNNVTLSIAAGTKVVTKGYFKIDVKGRLLAIGEPAKFIYFTTLDTARLRDTSTTRGGWKGLRFESITLNNDSSILKYCRIEFGKAVLGIRVEQRGGGIFIDSCSKILIQNCQIVDNISKAGGAGIQIVNNSSPKIIENLIKGNEAIGYGQGGGIASLENSAPIIQKNVIIENVAFGIYEVPGNTFAYGDGGGIYVSSRTNVTPLISSNLIANNYSIGGALYESSLYMRVYNNIIVNNFGGGIYNGHQRSASIYTNNTICNNYFFGGISSSGTTTLTFYNNIVRGNQPIAFGEAPNVYVSNNIYPKAFNNNIGELPTALRGNGNIDLPTLFERPTTTAGISEKGYEADWRLKQGSPEIDAGTTANGLLDVIGNKDFLGKPRVVGAAIDIGAIEYSPITSTITLNDLNVKIYPNPFSGQIWIDVEKPLVSAHYSIFSIDGKLISRDVLNQGTQLIQTEQFANGTYILTITDKNGKQVFNSKLVKN